MDTCISLPLMLIAAHVCGSSTSSGVGNVAFDYSILKGVQAPEQLSGIAYLVALVVMFLLLEFVFSGAAIACRQWWRRSLSYEVDNACLKLNLYKRLGLSRIKMLHDVRLIEQQYGSKSYHNVRHAADVVGKTGAMLRRDKAILRRWMRERRCRSMVGFMAERQKALFELALILAAAFHDAGHPGVNNAYLKNSQDARFRAYDFTAEKFSEQWFCTVFMAQQTVLNDLPEADMQFVVDVAAYAVLRTDMRVHKEVIQMADPDESNPLKRLAALLLHAADLANGADPWSLSALWARLCHQEFHTQGDTSRQEHPELPVDACFAREKADVPASQVFFIETFVAPTFAALQECCPRTAAKGLRGCKANVARCKAIIKQQDAEQQALPRML